MSDTPRTKAWFIKEIRDSLTGLTPEYIQEVVSDFEEHFDAGLQNGESEEEICIRLGDPKAIGEQLRQEASQTAEEETNARGQEQAASVSPSPEPRRQFSPPPFPEGTAPKGPPPATNQSPPSPPPPRISELPAGAQNSGGCLRSFVMFCLLGFFNLVFVLTPWIAAAAALFSMWIAAAALILSGIVCIAVGIIAPFTMFDWIALATPLSYFNAIMAGIALITGGILLFYAITLLNKGFYKLTARYIKWNCKAIGYRMEAYVL